MTGIFRTLRILLAALCLATVICPAALGAVTAVADRTTIALDETLNLTISKDSNSFFSGPDLSPLESDFTILGRNQTSSTQIINSTVTASVSWNIVLAPKRTGDLRIPAITVGNEETNPLTIHVVDRPEPKTGSNEDPLFLETEVDSRSVYVQSQLVYTLRIFVAEGVQAHDPGIPQIPDAVVEKLNDASYTKIVEGRSYQVFELKYAIFPQKSGVLEIPRIEVQATMPGQQRVTTFFGPFGNQGRKIQVRSRGEEVTVLEKPDSYPRSATWLPTDSLTVADKWSQNPENLTVGESATMTIEVTGNGLLGSQLPPIELGEVEGVKLYQGKAEVGNHATSEGITGSRLESVAMIPTRPGTVRLPEIRVPWWDTRTSRVEYAVIPAREVSITGDAQKTTPAPAAPPTPVSPSAQATIPGIPADTKPIFWITACAILAGCWLTTLLLLVRARRQLTSGGADGLERKNEALTIRENKAFTVLEKSCRANEPLAARKAIISWAKTACPSEKIHCLADLERIFPELAPGLKEIDRHLYGSDEKRKWQGNGLLAALKEVRKTGGKETKKAEILEPLYKSTTID